MKALKFDELDLLKVGNTIQMGGVIWTGDGQSFITLFPGKSEDLTNLDIMPMNLEEWLKFLRQTDTLETEIIGEDENGQVIKAIYRKSQRSIDNYVQWDVFRRDNYTCRYCGRTGIPLTVDHIILWEEGGPSVPENLLTACKQCNKDRGNMQYKDWMESESYAKRSNLLSTVAKEANLSVINRLEELSALKVKNIRSRK